MSDENPQITLASTYTRNRNWSVYRSTIHKRGLIPALTGRSPSDVERSLLGLPPRLGGMGITNPTTTSTQEYTASKSISLPLCELIREQLLEYPFDCIEAQTTAKKTVRQERDNSNKASVSSIREDASAALQRAMDLAQERGASSWLTSLPLKEFNLCLHKGAFRDAIALRYGWQPQNTPTHCSCTLFLVPKVVSPYCSTMR